MSQQGRQEEKERRGAFSAACPAPSGLALARARQGPRGAEPHWHLEIACRNSPELRRLLVDKAWERRANTSELDLIIGAPEPYPEGAVLVSAFRCIQPRALAIGKL